MGDFSRGNGSFVCCTAIARAMQNEEQSPQPPVSKYACTDVLCVYRVKQPINLYMIYTQTCKHTDSETGFKDTVRRKYL